MEKNTKIILTVSAVAIGGFIVYKLAKAVSNKFTPTTTNPSTNEPKDPKVNNKCKEGQMKCAFQDKCYNPGIIHGPGSEEDCGFNILDVIF